jgi:hypothetical protein
MNRAALLVLTSAVFLNSCSSDDLNGPFDFAGSCDVFSVEETTLATDPATVARFEILANCDMGSEIGETGAVVDMVVASNDQDNTLNIGWQAFYSTSQTDIMVASFVGTGTTVSASTFNFSGTETYEGGTNDFDDIFGSAEISGGTLTITNPGSGGWTMVGQID